MTETPDRHRRGLALLLATQGERRAAEIRAGFDAVSPAFGRYSLEAGFADVYARAGLTLAQRQLLNVAVLTAIGGAEPQLAIHVRGALHVGVSPREVVETVIHVSLYAGHPRTANGLRVVGEVFAEEGVELPLPEQPLDEPSKSQED